MLHVLDLRELSWETGSIDLRCCGPRQGLGLIVLAVVFRCLEANTFEQPATRRNDVSKGLIKPAGSFYARAGVVWSKKLVGRCRTIGA